MAKHGLGVARLPAVIPMRPLGASDAPNAPESVAGTRWLIQQRLRRIPQRLDARATERTDGSSVPRHVRSWIPRLTAHALQCDNTRNAWLRCLPLLKASF